MGKGENEESKFSRGKEDVVVVTEEAAMEAVKNGNYDGKRIVGTEYFNSKDNKGLSVRLVKLLLANN